MKSIFIAAAAGLQLVAAQKYSATYLPANVPEKTEAGQWGTNQCGTESSQNSTCQNVYINSVDDFCLWAPHTRGKIGDHERETVAYCLRTGYGTRLIPDGTIKGAHFLQTPDYVQVTGVGDLTKLNIEAGDDGGEMDPHGADKLGNPIGGLVFGTSMGGLQQYHEWTNFMSDSTFCLRGCKDGKDARKYCQHIYDLLGCEWNIPANYTEGIFEDCMGDTTYFQGLYSVSHANGTYATSTFRQGQPKTPDPHQPAPSSQCQYKSTISNQPAVSPTATYFSSASVTNRGGSSSAAAASSAGTSQNNVQNAGSINRQAALDVIGMVAGATLTFLSL